MKASRSIIVRAFRSLNSVPRRQFSANAILRANNNEQQSVNIQTPIVEQMKSVSSLEYELARKRATDRLERQKQQQYSETFVLGEKKPSESRVTISLPFSSDPKLRDRYMDNNGGVHLGRLLEDLDSMAGEIAYRHSDGFHPERPVTIVTASVDRIQLLEPLIPYFDLVFEGNVTFVGRSSMEVRIDVHTMKDHQQKCEALVAYFTMVAKDKISGQPVEVHKIAPETEREKRHFRLGEENKVRRAKMVQQSLQKQAPSEEEKFLLHDMFLKRRNRNGSYSGKQQQQQQQGRGGTGAERPERFMSSSVMNTTRLMYPQQRNIHNKIFGGYLLRQAYELAEITGALFSHDHPKFVSLDENAFLAPVEIGSILGLTGTVVFTTRNSCIVRVDARVLHPSLGTTETTNIFHFSFQAPMQAQVVPQSYEEGIMYLEGRRIWEKGQYFAQEIKRLKC